MGSNNLRHLIAGEIRAEMARQRKTGVELASLLQCSQQSASRRLSGTVQIDLDELAAIAGWLGLEAPELIARAQGSAA